MAQSQKHFELLSGSKSTSMQDTEFLTAGRDVFSGNSCNVHVHITSPEDLSSSNLAGLAFRQVWDRIFQPVSGFFQSPENRDATVHPLSGKAAGDNTHAMAGAQYSPGCAVSQQESQESATGSLLTEASSSEEFQDSNVVTEMSRLNTQELQSQDIITNAEIYTRSMLSSNAGLPCWYPEPRGSVGDRGIVPGDVGTFDLMDGFTKIFNIWEDETFPYQLPSRECFTRPDRFAEGHTIVNGLSAEVHRSEDGSYIETYQFRCKAKQGALLACTTPADLEQLVDVTSLRNFLIQHAGVIFQHASAIRRIADESSLYVVSGCIKSDSWALAAYDDPTEPSSEVLRLSRRKMSNLNTTRVPTYDWLARGTGEARFGSNSEMVGGKSGGKDQALFLRGFKLDFSQEFRARLNASLHVKTEQTAPGQSGVGSLTGRNQAASNQSKSIHNLSLSNHQSGLGCSDSSLSSGVQVDHFPTISRLSFHPSDKITQFLLKLTGADCALCHDDDWRHNPKFQPSSWNDLSCIGIIASQTINALNGVVYLIPNQAVSLLSSAQYESGTFCQDFRSNIIQSISKGNMETPACQPAFSCSELDSKTRVELDHARSSSRNTQSQLPRLSFGKRSKWGLAIFGGDKAAGPGTQKQLQPITKDSKLIQKSPCSLEPGQDDHELEKAKKKEAQQILCEAEKARRQLAMKIAREQARAVMQKRRQLLQVAEDTEWSGLTWKQDHYQDQRVNRPAIHHAKARRRDFDSDHSMSSDVSTLSEVSSMSSSDISDPGPAHLLHHPSRPHASLMKLQSSLSTTVLGLSPSADSFNPFSVEEPSPLGDGFHMHPSPQWVAQENVKDSGLDNKSTPYIPHTLPLSKPAINPIFQAPSYNWDSKDDLVANSHFVDSIQLPFPPPLLFPPMSPEQHHQPASTVNSNVLPAFSELEAVAEGDHSLSSSISSSVPPED